MQAPELEGDLALYHAAKIIGDSRQGHGNSERRFGETKTCLVVAFVDVGLAPTQSYEFT